MATNNYFDPNWTEKVTVPVKRVGESWEFFYGGDVPVKEGTLGELTINAHQITDLRFRKRVSQETMVKILNEGTALMVALSDRSRDGARIGEWPTVAEEDVPLGATRFERVTIGPVKLNENQLELNEVVEEGGLWLRLKGLERSELVCSTMQMPSGFSKKVAVSLNHAFTLLSQAYETHRISNTGNVYTKFFYQDANDIWYPLSDLRAGVQAQTERTLVRDVWKQMEELLGWRPVIADSRRKKR